MTSLEMYNLGVEAYNAENYEKALNLFQKALYLFFRFYFLDKA